MSPTVILWIVLAGGGAFGGWYITDLRADLAACEKYTEELNDKIREQNRAVQNLKAAGDAAQERAKKAQEAAAKANAKAAELEAPRRAAIASGTGPQTCLDAVAGWAK